MTTLRKVVTGHAATVYFMLTFAISWSGVLLATAGGGMSGTSPTSDPRFVYALVAMLAGPAISGILLTAIVNGTDGLRDLFSRATKWRVARRWYVIALLMAPALWSATLFALSIVSPRFLPALVTSPNKITLVATGFTVATAAGIFEEIGWTLIAILMHVSVTASVLTLEPAGLTGV